MGHKPLYCSTNDYYDCVLHAPYLRKLFEAMFRQYGVDLYLTGHVHNYEKTWPVFNGTIEAQSYSGVRDPVHVVIGSAGCDEGLTDRWESCPAWSAGVRDGQHVGYALLA